MNYKFIKVIYSIFINMHTHTDERTVSSADRKCSLQSQDVTIRRIP